MGKLRGNLKQTWHDPILKPLQALWRREEKCGSPASNQSRQDGVCTCLLIQEVPPPILTFSQVASVYGFWEVCLLIKLRVGAGLVFKTYNFNYPWPKPRGRLHTIKDQPYCTYKGWWGWTCHSDCTFITCRSSFEWSVSGERVLHCSEWFMIKTHTWLLINWLWHSLSAWVTLAVFCTLKGPWTIRLMCFCNILWTLESKCRIVIITTELTIQHIHH